MVRSRLHELMSKRAVRRIGASTACRDSHESDDGGDRVRGFDAQLHPDAGHRGSPALPVIRCRRARCLAVSGRSDQRQMDEFLSSPLEGMDVRTVHVDAKHCRDHCILIALGVVESRALSGDRECGPRSWRRRAHARVGAGGRTAVRCRGLRVNRGTAKRMHDAMNSGDFTVCPPPRQLDQLRRTRRVLPRCRANHSPVARRPSARRGSLGADSPHPEPPSMP